MRKLIKSKIINIFPFKAVEMDWDKRGLVRIQGRNGQGKSTLFNLMTMQLFSEAPVKRKTTEFVEDKKEHYLLENTWTFGGNTYVAAYSQNSKELNPEGEEYGSGVFLFENGINISEHKSPDTQKKITRYFGLSIEEWYAATYLSQATAHGLIVGTPSTRMQYFSNLVGISKLDDLSLFFAKKAEVLEASVKELKKFETELEINQTILSTKREASILNQEITELTTKLTELTSTEQVLLEVQAIYNNLVELNKYQSQVTDEHVQNKATYLKQVSDLEVSLAEENIKRNTLANLKAELQSLPQAAQKPQLPENHESFLQVEDLNKAQVEAEIQKLQGIKQILDQPYTPKVVVPEPLPQDYEQILNAPAVDIVFLNQHIKAIETRPAPPQVEEPKEEFLTELNLKLNNLAVEIQVMEAGIKKLKFSGAECPTCGTELNCKDREVELKGLEENYALKVQEHTHTKAQLDLALLHKKEWVNYWKLGPDRSSELPDLYKRREDHEKSILYKTWAEEKANQQSRLQLAEQLTVLPKLQKDLWNYDMKIYVKGLLEFIKTIEAAEVKQVELQAKINQIQLLDTTALTQQITQLKTLVRDIETYEQVSRNKKELEAKNPRDVTSELLDLRVNKTQVSDQLNSVKSELQMVTELQENVTKATKQILDKQTDYRNYRRYETLAKQYGNRGILRKNQLARFSKYFTNVLLPYTHRLLPHLSFEFDIAEGVEFNAINIKEGKVYDVKTLSGGERGALSVALMFATDDIQPPNKKLNIKIMDEIEAAMDKTRRQDFLNIVLPELKKRADTVVLVSHSDSARDVNYDVTLEIQDGFLKEVGEQRTYELG